MVFFRILTGNDQLASAGLPTGRLVEKADGDYNIYDAEGNMLGSYPVDFVCGVMPITTTGPAEQAQPNAPNRPN
jgi:hypothetical protein